MSLSAYAGRPGGVGGTPVILRRTFYLGRCHCLPDLGKLYSRFQAALSDIDKR